MESKLIKAKGISMDEYLIKMTELIKQEPENMFKVNTDSLAQQIDETWRKEVESSQARLLDAAKGYTVAEEDVLNYRGMNDDRRKAVDSAMDKNQKKALDAYTNNALMIGQADMFSSFDSYDFNGMLYAWPLWTSMYTTSWVFAKIVDVTGSDLIRNGWKVSINPEKEFQIIRKDDRLYRKDITPEYELDGVYERQSRMIPDIVSAAKWMYLYGGSVICLLDSTIESTDDYQTPLTEILPDAKLNYLVADRWQGVNASAELVDDDESPDFGTPKYYSVKTPDGLFYKFHHSRVARFVNGEAPNFLKGMLLGWGLPIGTRIYNEINRDERIKNMITSLLSKYNLEIVQTNGMKQYMHGELTPEMEANLDNKLSMINRYRHFNAMMFLDKDDEYSRIDGNVGGLYQLFDSNVRAVTGASSMPVVKIYGDQTAGLAGSSNDDMRLWEEHLASERGSKMKKPIDKITRWHLMAEQIPHERFKIKFNSSLTKTVSEQIDETRAVLDMYQQLINMGIYTNEMVVAELRTRDDLLIGDQLAQLSKEQLIEIEEEIDEDNREEEFDESMDGDYGGGEEFETVDEPMGEEEEFVGEEEDFDLSVVEEDE